MQILKQEGATCTETAVEMLIGIRPKHKHIQLIIDLFYEHGYALVEIQPLPSFIDPDHGFQEQLWPFDYCNKRFKEYLSKHKALIYQRKPDRPPHMLAWSPDVGCVDPALGSVINLPDFIYSAYILMEISK